MQDKAAYDAYMKKIVKEQNNTESLLQENLERSNEKDKIRMRRYKERDPQKKDKPKTRFSEEKQREYWKRKKRTKSLTQIRTKGGRKSNKMREVSLSEKKPKV